MGQLHLHRVRGKEVHADPSELSSKPDPEESIILNGGPDTLIKHDQKNV